jgi:hypothetical protein
MRTMFCVGPLASPRHGLAGVPAKRRGGHPRQVALGRRASMEAGGADDSGSDVLDPLDQLRPRPQSCALSVFARAFAQQVRLDVSVGVLLRSMKGRSSVPFSFQAVNLLRDQQRLALKYIGFELLGRQSAPVSEGRMAQSQQHDTGSFRTQAGMFSECCGRAGSPDLSKGAFSEPIYEGLRGAFARTL